MRENRRNMARIATKHRNFGLPTRQASDDAKAIATKYGLEFLPSS